MRAAVQEVAKDCEWCGTIFRRHRNASGRLEDLGGYQRRRFCSRECASYRGTVQPQSHRWRGRAWLKPRCEGCGAQANLQAHHCDQDITNNTSSNIQTLCASCHTAWHNRQEAAGIYPAGRRP